MNRILTNWPTEAPDTECPHCRCPIEISASSATRQISCPNCGGRLGTPLSPGSPWAGLIRTRRRIWLMIIGLMLLALLIAGIVYRRFVLSGIDIVGEATGGRTTAILAIVGALLVVAWLLVWLLLPVLIYLSMRDLRKRSAQLDLTTRLCLRHLARLASQSAPVAKGQPPEPPKSPSDRRSGPN